MAFDRMVDRPPHLNDREAAAQQCLGLVAHDVAHPLWPRPFGVVVVHAADDVADFLGFALPVAGGAQGMVEHDPPFGAADLFYQRLAFRVVDPPDLVLVEEIADLRLVPDKPKAPARESQTAGA